MSRKQLSHSTQRLLGYLAELGPRWGLPAVPCRVHGFLYLEARAVGEAELLEAVEIDPPALESALKWLTDYRLVERTPAGLWKTDSDPWSLMLQALEERRKREIGPALDLLRQCRDGVIAERKDGRRVSAQIEKLLALLEDLVAIDIQASRLSPNSLGRLVRLGGRAARFVERRSVRGS